MPRVEFTPNLERHLSCPVLEVSGSTVREVLEESCRQNPGLRSYLLDDQGRVRKHVAVFVDGAIISDRVSLSETVENTSTVFVMQALSGG